MVFEKTLAEIVDENYVYARALHYLGISFLKEPNKELGQICKERGLDRTKVIKSFYLFDSSDRLSFKELENYPLDLLMEYLKHVHHLFIKEKLPFIVHLAKHCRDSQEIQKFLPEFVEDFITHIYEEEDTVFKYVKTLSEISRGRAANPYKELIRFNHFSLVDEFEHHQGDDEMGALRSLIEPLKSESLKEQVLIQEVRAFDREMLYHAEIENKIFFPQAIRLEKEVSALIKRTSSLN